MAASSKGAAMRPPPARACGSQVGQADATVQPDRLAVQVALWWADLGSRCGCSRAFSVNHTALLNLRSKAMIAPTPQVVRTSC